MGFKGSKGVAILLLLFVAVVIEIKGISAQNSLTCKNRWSPCYRRVIRCPKQCPVPKPSHPNAKGCFLDCNSPKCEAVCREVHNSVVSVLLFLHLKTTLLKVLSMIVLSSLATMKYGIFYFHGRKG